MKRILSAIVISLFTVLAHADCTSMVYKGIYPKAKEPVTILCHKRYVVGYSTERKAPLWTAEVLTAAQVAAATGVRSNNFRPNPAIPRNQQATIADFIGTGDDRGHMVPFEDLADDLEAADEGFYLTNIVAQVAQNNRGIWNALEGRTRKLATAKGQIYIVTGPIFDGTPAKLKSGAQIPTRLWKMVLAPSTVEAYTVIIPNAPGLATSSMPLYFSTIPNLKKTNLHVDPLPVTATFISKRSF